MNEILQQLIPLARPAAYLLTAVALGLFIMFRYDYRNCPEPTLLAAKLTLSMMTHILSFGIVQKKQAPSTEPAPEPTDDDGPQTRKRPTPTDMGTISRPVQAFPPPKRKGD